MLVLGLGGGAVTKRWWRDYPDMTIDTVEIDPVVIDVAQRYFGLPDDERIRVVNQDARRFVQESSAKYDVIIVDCYYADSLPSHLTTTRVPDRGQGPHGARRGARLQRDQLGLG